MSDCKCKDQTTIPDFTKEGFGGKRATQEVSMTSATHTVESFHQLLADQGISALDISACASASLNNGTICFNFPIVGNICFKSPIPLPPVGATLKACGTVCTKLGVIPVGVMITLYVNNSPVWNGTVWGSC